MNLLAQISVPTLCCSIHEKVGEDFFWFWLGRKTGNSIGAVSWSAASLTKERLLTIVNNTAFIHYTMIKNHIQQPQGVSVWSQKG